jgi:hypothetical protein
MTDYILAEFKGTYRAPHPDGIRDQNVTRNFNVKVKMKRECLNAPGLNGFFGSYYKEFLRKLYPDMIDTYKYEMVQATELDGKPIDSPKALPYEGLLQYIFRKKYPINPTLYSPKELRNQINLYEEDPKGQQFLEEKLQRLRGNQLAIAAELQSMDDVISICSTEPPKAPAAVGRQPGKSAAG